MSTSLQHPLLRRSQPAAHGEAPSLGALAALGRASFGYCHQRWGYVLLALFVCVVHSMRALKEIPRLRTRVGLLTSMCQHLLS